MLWCHGECFHIWKDAFLLVSFEFVGSKAKGRISKRVLQENKAKFCEKQIFLTPLYAQVRVRIKG